MGWAYGTNADGRAIGYGVEATCDKDACDDEIDRGVDYVCGGMHDGGEYGCGRYFCGDHLLFTDAGQLCEECADAVVGEDDEGDDDEESRQLYCGPDCPRVDHTICLFDAKDRAQRLEHRHEFDVGAPADYWLGVIAAQVDIAAGRERDEGMGLMAPLDWLRGYDETLEANER